MLTPLNSKVRMILAATALLSLGLGGCVATVGPGVRHYDRVDNYYYDDHHDRYYDYYYYPSLDIYLDIATGYYWHHDHDHWARVKYLPRHLHPRDHERVFLRLDTDQPHRYHKQHRDRYRHPQRHGGLLPGRDDQAYRGAGGSPRQRANDERRGQARDPGNRGRYGDEGLVTGRPSDRDRFAGGGSRAARRDAERAEAASRSQRTERLERRGRRLEDRADRTPDPRFAADRSGDRQARAQSRRAADVPADSAQRRTRPRERDLATNPRRRAASRVDDQRAVQPQTANGGRRAMTVLQRRMEVAREQRQVPRREANAATKRAGQREPDTDRRARRADRAPQPDASRDAPRERRQAQSDIPRDQASDAPRRSDSGRWRSFARRAFDSGG